MNGMRRRVVRQGWILLTEAKMMLLFRKKMSAADRMAQVLQRIARADAKGRFDGSSMSLVAQCVVDLVQKAKAQEALHGEDSEGEMG